MRVEGIKSRSFHQLMEDVNERLQQLEANFEVCVNVQTHSTTAQDRAGKWVHTYEAVLTIK